MYACPADTGPPLARKLSLGATDAIMRSPQLWLKLPPREIPVPMPPPPPPKNRLKKLVTTCFAIKLAIAFNILFSMLLKELPIFLKSRVNTSVNMSVKPSAIDDATLFIASCICLPLDPKFSTICWSAVFQASPQVFGSLASSLSRCFVISASCALYQRSTASLASTLSWVSATSFSLFSFSRFSFSRSIWYCASACAEMLLVILASARFVSLTRSVLASFHFLTSLSFITRPYSSSFACRASVLTPAAVASSISFFTLAISLFSLPIPFS